MKYYIEYSETETKEVSKEEFDKECNTIFIEKERIAKKYTDDSVTLILW